MANIASSKKDARRSAVRAVRNRSLKSSVKTKVTKVRRAVAEGTAEALNELTGTAIASLDRAVAKGVLHRNNAARRKSRLLKLTGATVAAPVDAPKKGTTARKPAAKAPAKAAAKPAAKKPAVKKPAAKK